MLKIDRFFKVIVLPLIIYGCIVSNFLQAHYDPKKEKVIICGVGKNIAPHLTHMIRRIEELGKSFADYRVFIYENNSTDRTPELLNQWANRNPKVFVTTEALAPEQLHKRTIGHALRDKAPCRMELIAYARNRVLEQALHESLDDFHFIVMTDLDFSRGWDVRGVLSSFYLDLEWDCLSANGVDGNNNYYDRFAYRDEQFPLGPELIGEDFWHQLGRTPFSLALNGPVRQVYSAFGGIAIYKKDSIQHCRYSGYITPDLEKFIAEILKQVKRDNWQYLTYEKIVGTSRFPLPVVFQANCGYDSPVVCEHSTFHASMILQGCTKIYVNPAMICHY